ncbi:probable cyclin-dependent kinase 10, partial [Copidosoma floridanum]|uniref:probable cyclin-dependent kinase 10 n=1 Tax=Copidosoma floridanum TaxID=29053 RepID=UPI0006C942FA
LASVSAGYGTNLLEKSPTSPHKTLEDLLPSASEKALHLVQNLIVFNPNHRLTAVEALEHPYVARYTKGIDMWSLGCILGEMLLGKPLFPGSSTINQVERIMATLPPPTPEDLASVSAGYGTNLLEKSPTSPHKTLEDLLPSASEKALHLVQNLIVFNPNHRLTAVEALEHPYVARISSTNISVQYAGNRMNGSFRNFTPGQAKSCLYLNQNQISRSQHSMESDQRISSYGFHAPDTQKPKLLRPSTINRPVMIQNQQQCRLSTNNVGHKKEKMEKLPNFDVFHYNKYVTKISQVCHNHGIV